MQRAKDSAEQLILQAEKFKADVTAPKGKQVTDFSELFKNKFRNELEFKRFFVDDDDFFHISCHIEEKLNEKIKNSPVTG